MGVVAQKLAEAQGGRLVLEDKHISSNSVDHWQQFLHQQHVSVTLPVILGSGSTKTEYGTTKFR